MGTQLCHRCDGAGRVRLSDDEVVRCPNAACEKGWVSAFYCKRCTGTGCSHCGDTGLESCRRELEFCGEHPVVKVDG